MSLLQSDLVDEPSEHWTPEQLEQADRVAKRLLGMPNPVAAGTYIYVHAMDNFEVGDFVVGINLGMPKSGDFRIIPL